MPMSAIAIFLMCGSSRSTSDSPPSWTGFGSKPGLAERAVLGSFLSSLSATAIGDVAQFRGLVAWTPRPARLLPVILLCAARGAGACRGRTRALAWGSAGRRSRPPARRRATWSRRGLARRRRRARRSLRARDRQRLLAARRARGRHVLRRRRRKDRARCRTPALGDVGVDVPLRRPQVRAVRVRRRRRRGHERRPDRRAARTSCSRSAAGSTCSSSRARS